jgi:hypothetical protein
LVASDSSSEVRLSVRPNPTHLSSSTIVVADAGEFGPFSVSAGFETRGIELRVSSHIEYRIPVRVRDATGRVPPGTEVNGLPVDADGTVTLGPFRPGPIVITAVSPGGNARLAADARVVIEDRVPDEIVLQLLPAARLNGRVVFSGIKQPPRRGSPLRVLPFIPGQGSSARKGMDPTGMVMSDGSFEIDGLIGMRCFQLTEVPREWSQRITLGGRDVTDIPLTFRSGDQIMDLEVHVGPAESMVHRDVCKTP